MNSKELLNASLLEYLASNIRIRFESGRKRLDMHDVVHLDMKLPVRDKKGNYTGESCWQSVSVTDLKDI